MQPENRGQPLQRKRRRRSTNSGYTQDKKRRHDTREDTDHQIDGLYPSWHDKEGHFTYNLGESLGDVIDTREPERLRYKLIDKLGKGTFGLVLLAWDRVEDRYVALKIVRAIKKYTESAQIEIDILTKIQRSTIMESSSSKKISLFGAPRSEAPKKVVRKDIPKQSAITLDSWFTYKAHVVMVFPKYGLSLYDFLKKNRFRPFMVPTIKEMAYILFSSLYHLHSNVELIHTDLKPENILFMSSDVLECEAPRDFPSLYNTRKSRPPTTPYLVPSNPTIKLIDFGSAIYNHEHHSSIISTRHYRAPEVILQLGWSYASDIWSVGCILLEFYTGETLFQTHHNIEHLAMMEMVLGPVPSHILLNKCIPLGNSSDSVSTDSSAVSRYFKTRINQSKRHSAEQEVILDWPRPDTSSNSERRVRSLKSLAEIIRKEDVDLGDLVRRCLDYDQHKRITAEQAMSHPFFDSIRQKYTIPATPEPAPPAKKEPIRPSPKHKDHVADDSYSESRSSYRYSREDRSRERYHRERDNDRSDRDYYRSDREGSRDRKRPRGPPQPPPDAYKKQAYDRDRERQKAYGGGDSRDDHYSNKRERGCGSSDDDYHTTARKRTTFGDSSGGSRDEKPSLPTRDDYGGGGDDRRHNHTGGGDRGDRDRSDRDEKAVSSREVNSSRDKVLTRPSVTGGGDRDREQHKKRGRDGRDGDRSDRDEKFHEDKKHRSYKR